MSLNVAFQSNIFDIVGNTEFGLRPNDVVSHLPEYRLAAGQSVKEFKKLSEGDEGYVLYCWADGQDLFSEDTQPSSRARLLIKVCHNKVEGELTDHPLVKEAAYLYVVNKALPSMASELLGLGKTEADDVMMVMEFVDGTPISDVIFSDDSFSNECYIQLFSFVALFLGLKSFLQVDHGDLHIGNIIVMGPDSEGNRTFKIIDFGYSAKSTTVDTFDKLFCNLNDFGVDLNGHENLRNCVTDINEWKSDTNIFKLPPGCVYWFSISRKYGSAIIVNSLFPQILHMMPLTSFPDVLDSFLCVCSEIETSLKSNQIIATEFGSKIVNSILHCGSALDGILHHFVALPFKFCGIQHFPFVLLILPNLFEILVCGIENIAYSLQGISVDYINKLLLVLSLSQGIPTPYVRSTNIEVLNRLSYQDRIENEAEFLWNWLRNPTSILDLHSYWNRIASSRCWVRYR